jgi:23S rRNA pseudouridine2605 synthase
LNPQKSIDEKLQKVLARAGIASRRESERWISAGRISVNGKIATLGDRVKAEDQIRVDGNLLREENTAVASVKFLMYNKPEGEVSTNKDPDGRPTVFDTLPKLHRGRWIQIGRLDVNTSGLLLFTNDGELANRLMHPSSEIQREYATRVFGEVTDDMKARLRKGVQLEDGIASFNSIKPAGGEGINRWYHVTLGEGKNREVRRLWESQEGLRVSRLIRLRYGVCSLDRQLPRGRWRSLTAQETREIMKSVKYQAEVAEDSKAHGKRSIKQRDVKDKPSKKTNVWKNKR